MTAAPSGVGFCLQNACLPTAAPSVRGKHHDSKMSRQTPSLLFSLVIWGVALLGAHIFFLQLLDAGSSGPCEMKGVVVFVVEDRRWCRKHQTGQHTAEDDDLPPNSHLQHMTEIMRITFDSLISDKRNSFSFSEGENRFYIKTQDINYGSWLNTYEKRVLNRSPSEWWQLSQFGKFPHNHLQNPC